MLVNNGKIILPKVLINGRCQYNDEAGIISIEGDPMAATTAITNSTLNNYSYVRMQLGVGDTPVTINDYYLDDVLVDNTDVNTLITCQTTSGSPTVSTSSVLYTYVFKNSSAITITIKEIAIIVQASSTSSIKAMIAREVITPRTVQPDETITFSYEIKF